MSHKSAMTEKALSVLRPEVVNMIAALHKQLNATRLELLKARNERQAQYDTGVLPEFVTEEMPAHGDWQVAPIPEDLLQRRVEITGPVNSAKMVINMLNPNADGIHADTAMLDFEDSMKPSWNNVIDGIINVRDAVNGSLSFFDETKNKQYELNAGKRAKVMIRVRGLHLDESNIQVNGEKVSGGLLDFVASLYHTAKPQLDKGITPKFYVPKTEHYLEARWWNTLFTLAQELMGLKKGTIRATFLIETLPGAFQMEEILYEIREHAAALNVGRWDKIFSDIKTLRNHPDRVMADRASINMHRPWMENYAKRLIKICHKHGAMAIGGMSAFTPGKDKAQVDMQLEKVIKDKRNEATIGHDGCWVSHPFFVGPALEQFEHKNQLNVLLEDFPMKPDLIPQSVGDITEAGLRTNVRVGIAYQKGWNDDIGCVSWDGLMEDLATLEISRAQVWQWIKNEKSTKEGDLINKAFLKKLFEEELEKIRGEISEQFEGEKLKLELAKFKQAKDNAEELFLRDEFADFLSMESGMA